VQRQVWIFLTAGDEEQFWSRVAASFPVRRLRGRFFRGTLDDLRARPESLETQDARRGERWTHLVHATASRELVATPVEEGPFQGYLRLDEVRSEVVSLVRVEPEGRLLGPSRLQAATHAWFNGQRLRKSPEFARWTSELFKMAEEYPRSAFDWMHVAPGARAFAEAGGRLQYLYRDVGLEPPADSTLATRPHKRR
jgi:hypothetical protein